MKRLPMDEGTLLGNIIDLCRTAGRLHTAHFRPARTKDGRYRTPVQGDGTGWPDLVIVGPGGILYRELKSARGKTSPEQKNWIGWLTEADADVDVWRPRDWWDDTIRTRLDALRRPRRRQQPAVETTLATRPGLPYRSPHGDTVHHDGRRVLINGRSYSPADALDLSAAIARAVTACTHHQP